MLVAWLRALDSTDTNLLRPGESAVVTAWGTLKRCRGEHEYYADEFQVSYIFSVVFVALAMMSCVVMLFPGAQIERSGTESKVCVYVWRVRRVLEACAPVMLLLSSALATATTLGVSSVEMFAKFTDIECDLGGGFIALTWLAFCLQAFSTYLVLERVGGRRGQEKQSEPKDG